MLVCFNVTFHRTRTTLCIKKKKCHWPFWAWVARGSRCSCRTSRSCCSSWRNLDSPGMHGLYCTSLGVLLLKVTKLGKSFNDFQKPFWPPMTKLPHQASLAKFKTKISFRRCRSTAAKSRLHLETVMISVTYHLNLCPISPWPFVYALSSHLREWGHIMQRNNGAPLCQLAPISRTYRLCQNSLAPTVPRCLWPEWGSFIQEASKQQHSPLNCVRRNEAGGAVGECLLCVAWRQHGTSSEERRCLVREGAARHSGSERGTKRGHAPPQRLQWWPAAAGSDCSGRGTKAGGYKLHVTPRDLTGVWIARSMDYGIIYI